ncbi:MAG TPA: hypothetical protein VIG99_20585 [Myxococcaceae bacterium]
MKQRAIALLLVLLAAPALGGPQPVPEQYARNLRLPLQDRLCEAARALVRVQGDFHGTSASWEWIAGSGQAAPNTAGLVAVALVQAPESCGGRDALRRFAAARAAQHRAGDFLFDPDVEALALAARKLGWTEYATVARDAFERRYGPATGEEIVGRLLMIRGASPIVGYDAALAIRAALAVGERRRAIEIADAALAAIPRWGERQADRQGALTSARGALLEALAMAGADRYQRAARDLIHHLVLGAGTDGSWSGHVTQSTAYAVRGLSRWPEPAALEAAERGRRWLRLTQLGDGTWSTFNDWLPEPFVGDRIPGVTAETMLALYF